MIRLIYSKQLCLVLFSVALALSRQIQTVGDRQQPIFHRGHDLCCMLCVCYKEKDGSKLKNQVSRFMRSLGNCIYFLFHGKGKRTSLKT